ncbi:LysE family translocator [Arenibaculum pallidiluteum]|uniref:LysE family translocator n=1 Tax=Arenibaculum pallidiluteum TaxID=2812559 RepID=UPI002E2DA47E|nr:LysE family transporter [Arenibaculum pallidiluteum]
MPFLFDEFGVLVRGIIMGFVIAAPVGPIALLCVRRTLEHGVRFGVATGLGAALADTVYGAVAAFGVQVLIDLLTGHQTAFRMIGGAFMVAVAVHGFRARSLPEGGEVPDPPGLAANFATGLVLTLFNPLTVFGFLAIFAGFGLGGGLGNADAATVVVGVFLGASLWWLILNAGVAAIGHRINDAWFRAINRTAAGLLLAFGAYAVVSAIGELAWA